MPLARSFAIGDIHGCNKAFQHLLQQLNIQREDTLYCLGDYIDRGPDSKGVIDTILYLRGEGYTVHTLPGNHEQLLLQSEENRQHRELWLRNGGDTTLKSFGVKKISQMPPQYLDFFNKTEFFFEKDKYILVHAGLNFLAEDPFADREAMLWIRNGFIDLEKLAGRTIVHGHTPKQLTYIRAQQFENEINLDAGCVYNGYKGLGHLVAMNLSTREITAVKNAE